MLHVSPTGSDGWFPILQIAICCDGSGRFPCWSPVSSPGISRKSRRRWSRLPIGRCRNRSSNCERDVGSSARSTQNVCHLDRCTEHRGLVPRLGRRWIQCRSNRWPRPLESNSALTRSQCSITVVDCSTKNVTDKPHRMSKREGQSRAIAQKQVLMCSVAQRASPTRLTLQTRYVLMIVD